jgi:hypothetical protein
VLTLTGNVRIGTVPVAQGGSGVTDAAVLQQWSAVAAGTVRIDFAVNTTDGQTLIGWAYQPVG